MRFHELKRSFVSYTWKATVIIAAADYARLQKHFLVEFLGPLHFVIVTFVDIFQVDLSAVPIRVHFEKYSVNSISQKVRVLSYNEINHLLIV